MEAATGGRFCDRAARPGDVTTDISGAIGGRHYRRSNPCVFRHLVQESRWPEGWDQRGRRANVGPHSAESDLARQKTLNRRPFRHTGIECPPRRRAALDSLRPEQRRRFPSRHQDTSVDKKKGWLNQANPQPRSRRLRLVPLFNHQRLFAVTDLILLHCHGSAGSRVSSGSERR